MKRRFFFRNFDECKIFIIMLFLLFCGFWILFSLYFSQSCLENKNATCLLPPSTLPLDLLSPSIFDFFSYPLLFQWTETHSVSKSDKKIYFFAATLMLFGVIYVIVLLHTAWLVQTGYRTFWMLLWLGPLAFVSNAFSFFFLLSDDLLCCLLWSSEIMMTMTLSKSYIHCFVHTYIHFCTEQRK